MEKQASASTPYQRRATIASSSKADSAPAFVKQRTSVFGSPNKFKHSTTMAKKKKKKPKKRPKPQVTKEQLNAVVHSVFAEADEDGNGDLDLNECRAFLQKLMHRTYPEVVWDEEKFKRGYYNIDVDHDGQLDFREIFEIIYSNAFRQGMVIGSKVKDK